MEETGNTEKSERKKKKKRSFGLKLLRGFGKFMIGLFILIVGIILFVRSPWGQDIIIDKAVSYLEDKIGTDVGLEKAYIGFDGSVNVEGLHLRDRQGDTLLYAGDVEGKIGIWPLLNDNTLNLGYADLDNITAKIIRKDTVSGFNFNYITEAFDSGKPKDSTPPLKFDIGPVELNDIKVIYDDEVTGIDLQTTFQELAVTPDEIDLNTMRFTSETIMLRDADVSILQSPALYPESEEQTDTTASQLPFLAADNIELSDVSVDFTSQVQEMKINSEVSYLQTSIPILELNKQAIVVDQLDINDTRFSMEMAKNKKVSDTTSSDGAQESPASIWPEWKVKASDLTIDNSHFELFRSDEEVTPGTFNPDAIVLSDLNVSIPSVFLKEGQAKLDLDKLTLIEGSGMEITKLELAAEISDDYLALSGLKMRADGNRLSGSASAKFASLTGFIKNPQSAQFDLNLDNLRADVSEFFRFQPSLRQNQYLKQLAKAPIMGSITANGSLENMQVDLSQVRWRKTIINATGTLRNPTEPEDLAFDFPSIRLTSQKRDLQAFYPVDSLGVKFSKEIRLTADVSGQLDDIQGNANLFTSLGNVEVSGSYKNQEELAFDVRMNTENLAVGELLNNPTYGDLDLIIEANGSGSSLNTLDGNFTARVDQFNYNDYQIQDLKLEGEADNGYVTASSRYKDRNLNLNLQAEADLDTTQLDIQTMLDVKGADLYALGLTKKEIAVGFDLEAAFEGTVSDFEADAKLMRGITVYQNQSYLIGDIEVHAFVEPDTTSLNVDNRLVSLELQSNTDPSTFSQKLKRHFDKYIDDSLPADTVDTEVMVSLRGRITDSPVLDEVFLRGIEEMDTLTFSLDYNEKKTTLTSKLSLPSLTYNGMSLDSLNFDLVSDPRIMDFTFGFQKVDAGLIQMKNTQLVGNVEGRELQLDLLSETPDEKYMHIASSLSRKRDKYHLHIINDSLILNSNNWTVDEGNFMHIGENSIDLENFRLFRNNKSIALTKAERDDGVEQLMIDFDNFNLQALLNILNPVEPLLAGKVNGELAINDPFGKTAISADMQVDSLQVLQTLVGKMDVDAKAKGGNDYSADIGIKGERTDLTINGNYQAKDTTSLLDLGIDIQQLDMRVIQGLSQGFISKADGTLNGNIQIDGSTTAPDYEGYINFDDATVKVSMLDNTFLMDDLLRLDQDGLYLDYFVIDDKNGNQLSLTGDIYTESLLNPKFDLEVYADEFLAVDSKAEDNDLFYGKLVVDLNGSLTGDTQVPIMDFRARVHEDTDFTYVMPVAQAGKVSREGVVQFVNRENPDAILTRTEKKKANVTGYRISSLLRINKGATFNVILDQNTGDNLEVVGTGELDYDLFPNGNMTLAGRYEMSDGHYELNLYDIVQRKFQVADGSAISWSGDPYDADLDVRAYYEVKANPNPIIAGPVQTTERVPVQVFLNVQGDLETPEVNFSLDIPQNERGEFGQAYGAIQQLNTTTNDLNKQVFSLLVLKQFYPRSSNDGTDGGINNIARNNLNSAIADQLNNLAGSVLGDTGVELNFGVDSYTDYRGEGATTRTDVDITASKSFLDNRLRVSVGSEVGVQGNDNQNGESTPVIGNVSVEYLLTEQGRWRLKGFRRTAFDNIVDGQIIISGIGIIYDKEFNKFSELFNGKPTQEEEPGPDQPEQQQEATEKEEEENEENEESTDSVKDSISGTLNFDRKIGQLPTDQPPIKRITKPNNNRKP